MRRIIATVVLGLVSILALATPSVADTTGYLDEAVQGLQASNVYVSVEVQVITAATKEQLIQQTDGTNIGIVVLPEGARSEIGDLPQFVSQVKSQSNQKTVIVAVGNDLESSNASASKLANSLEKTSSSTGDALVKFVTETQAAPAGNTPQTNVGPDVSGYIIAVVVIIALGTGGAIWRRTKRKPQSESIDDYRQEHENFVPSSIQSLLSDLGQYTIRHNNSSVNEKFWINDDGMRTTLVKAISDTEELFKRLAPMGTEKTMRAYEEGIAKMRFILRKYVDIQNHPDFHAVSLNSQEHKKLLQVGKRAVFDYANGVLRDIVANEKGSFQSFLVDSSLINQRFGDDWSMELDQ
ncbi:MAG TPA: hypothetical protein VF281_02410 [Candidatus Saccharimonadales bacterium]